MKIRQGFVSNSSSTSFTFLFKGNNVDDLCIVLPRYADCFRLRFESYDDRIYRCDVNDVIASIMNAVVDNPTEDQKECDLYGVYVVPIDEAIEGMKKTVRGYRERIDELENEKEYRKSVIDYYYQDTWDEEDRILLFEKGKKRGLNCVIEIDFGDNHGHIQGGNIGMAMDYEGRYIRINQDDLIVVTEQHR